MRSSRIARQAARVLGAAAVSALLLGAVSATPAHAAHGVKYVSVTSGAHGV
ncbi:hypothetical protein [uncultured Friedmanniella sp.]|uniref:hypothetical protein n=1 Tax=uncultured Friedmanniella sp. TaxID=335381 RepID=UPI0035C9E552